MPQQLKSVNQLRTIYFLTASSTAKDHGMPYKPRWLNRLYAFVNGNFWLPCHKCKTKFGGHEGYGSDFTKEHGWGVGICPECTLKVYNETGWWNIESKDSH